MDSAGVVLAASTGAVVMALSYALDHLWASAIPFRSLYLLIRAPGVVLHECSHMIGCLLTGARIRQVTLFSGAGGSVTYSRPVVPIIGDVLISTAPLFLLPLVLSLITLAFSRYCGCTFPVFPPVIESMENLPGLLSSIAGTFSDNLIARFNAWFLVYLYLTISLVLSFAPSTQDIRNAAAGSAVLILAAVMVMWSGIPGAVAVLDSLVRLLGYGFTLGLVYGFVALAASAPVVAWYAAGKYR